MNNILQTRTEDDERRQRLRIARFRARTFLERVKREAGELAPTVPAGPLAVALDELARMSIPEER